MPFRLLFRSSTDKLSSSSPQLPTPRRSLFTSNSFHTQGESFYLHTPLPEGIRRNTEKEGTSTPPARWEGVRTPPIPSSSPGFGPDSMDMSPLPHKAPFSLTSQVPSQSPSRGNATVDEDMLSPCEAPPAPSFLQVPRQPGVVEYVISRFFVRLSGSC